MEASWGIVGFNILVVNDDVDVFNPAEVIHAWSTRVHPERSIHVRRGTGNPVGTWGSPQEKLSLDLPCTLYDATWPVDWPSWDVPRKSSFKALYPEETQKKPPRCNRLVCQRPDTPDVVVRWPYDEHRRHQRVMHKLLIP